mmetsp:Transcript_60660/g.130218  ORF Transcript_60660/g.130218 Transcript_60660/m.130218 type:complete len:325 (-) Transcript_60660:1542-2516(-)
MAHLLMCLRLHRGRRRGAFRLRRRCPLGNNLAPALRLEACARRPLAVQDGVPCVGAEAGTEGSPCAHPLRLARAVVPVRKVPHRQGEVHHHWAIRLDEHLCETFQDPLRLAASIPRDRGWERQVQLRHIMASARAGVLYVARDRHAGIANDGLRLRVLDHRGAVREEPIAKGVGHAAAMRVVPPVADQRFVAQGAVSLRLDLVTEGYARALVADRAGRSLALREGEGQAPGGLMPFVVQRHGNSTSIALPGQPSHHQPRHLVVPSACDHRPWSIHRHHDLLAHLGILPDQLRIRRVQLQCGAVHALTSFGRHHHHEHNVGALGM